MKYGCIKVISIVAVMSVCSIAFATGAQSGKIKTFVSIVPQKYFVEKIGGDRVDVSVMVLPGNSPATYEPRPKQMVALSKAGLYYAIGVPFEAVWLEKIAASNTNLLLVHTDDGIGKKPMKKDKPHGIKDPHVWLSPPLVMIQARNILRGLVTVDPVNRSIYEANYKKFIVELVDLDAELRGILLGKAKARFMVFHPAWGYFAHAYDLEMVPIETEGKDPKPADLQRLIGKAKKYGIDVIFVQPEFSSKSAAVIAKEIEGQVISADPLAPDWARNLKEVAASFKAALR